jgi:hypothetical protein
MQLIAHILVFLTVFHAVNSLLSTSDAVNAINDPSAVCSFNQPDVNRNIYFTIVGRNDGLGAVLMRMVPAAAYAYKHGWNFAGIMGRNSNGYAHNVFGNAVLDFYFGDARMLFATHYFKTINISLTGQTSGSLTQIKYHVGKNNSVLQLNEIVNEWHRNISKYTVSSQGAPILILHYNHDNFFHTASKSDSRLGKRFDQFELPLSQYIDDEFLLKLRQGASCGIHRTLSITNHFKSLSPRPSKIPQNLNTFNQSDFKSHRRINIAVHIRQGDVGPSLHNDAWKWVALPWYYHVLLHLEQLLSHVNIHIFTSVMSYKPEFAKSTNITLQGARVFWALGYKGIRYIFYYVFKTVVYK